jgi:hypothetical protein
MKRAKWMVLGASLYSAICLIVFWKPRLVAVTFDHVPGWLTPALTTLAGPALLLVDEGSGAVFFSLIGLVVGSLAGRHSRST